MIESYTSEHYDDTMKKYVSKITSSPDNADCCTKIIKSHVAHINENGEVEQQYKSKSVLPNHARFQLQSEIGVTSGYHYAIYNKTASNDVLTSFNTASEEIYNIGAEITHLFSSQDNGYDKELLDVAYDVALCGPRELNHVTVATLHLASIGIVVGCFTSAVVVGCTVAGTQILLHNILPCSVTFNCK